MNAENKALCYFYRVPPPQCGVPALSCPKIALMVRKQDGTHPTAEGVRLAVRDFHTLKQKRGRKKGWKKTSAAEDQVVLRTFHQVRPPGAGVVAREVNDALPARLQGKVCLKTIRSRLAEKGYKPGPKLEKADLNRRTCKARMAFVRAHEHRTGAMWQHYLHGVADLKIYTFYPKNLKLRFLRYNAKWTYMTQKEKQSPAFAKPKKMFTNKEYKKVIQGKVFGITLSDGQQLLCHVSTPFTAKDFAKLVRHRVGPFIQRAFPNCWHKRVLFDGEPLLHAPVAKEALAEFGIHALPNWPGYSPDLNPQENVWPWIEKKVRKEECYTDSFSVFRSRLTRLSKAYPNPESLVKSMASRIAECKRKRGAMTQH